MKKIIVFTLLLIISATSFSQQTKSSPPSMKQEYLEKSKHQKTAANIMLFGGVALMVGPTIFVAIVQKGGSATFPIMEVAFVIGHLSILTSIPFYIAAHGNKKKGMNLSFKTESVPQLQKSSFVYKSLPSLSLKISL